MRFAIYQAPFEQSALGYQPGADYEVVWEGELERDDSDHFLRRLIGPEAPPPIADASDELDRIFVWFQRVDPEGGPWPPEGYEGRSVSVGDVIVLDGWAAFAVDMVGFSAVDLFRPVPARAG